MNNLSSYCGLVDANIRASDKDLPVLILVSLHCLDATPYATFIYYVNMEHLLEDVQNGLLTQKF